MFRGCCAALILLGGAICGGVSPMAAPQAPQQYPAPKSDQIRIIVQNQGADQDDPDVAAFSPDDRQIVTLSTHTSDQVLLRDAATGAVINRLTMPPAPDDDTITYSAITFGRTGRVATATAFATNDGPRPRCRWVTYAIDFVAMQVVPTYTDKGPDDCGMLAPSFDRLNGLLARAHHSGLQLLDSYSDSAGNGLYVVDAAGKLLRTLQKPAGSAPTLGIRHAAMADDGQTLAVIIDRNGGVAPSNAAQSSGTAGTMPIQHSTIALFDTTQMQFHPGAIVTGSYTHVQWIEPGKVLLTRRYIAGERDVSPNMHEDRSLIDPPPALVFDTATATVAASVPMRCFLAPLPHGGFIGAALANCLSHFDAPKRGLERYEPGAGWSGFAPGIEGPNGTIDAIAVSPDGRAIGVIVRSTRDSAGDFTALVIDADSGAVTARLPLGSGLFVTALAFEPGGRSLLIQTDERHLLWTPSGGKPATSLWSVGKGDIGSSPDLAVSDGGTVVDSLGGGATMLRIRRSDGHRMPDLAFDSVVAFGFVPGKPQFWAASADDGVRFWDTRNWVPMQTLVLFGGQHFLAYMQDGRYDTDLAPDTSAFRWLVADEPLRSLGPQTFMRTYYTPRLVAREEQCIMVSGGCARAFPKMPAPVELNRVLPTVTIDAVRPGKQPGTAVVEVSASAMIDPAAPNHLTNSGLYDLRLFRNDSLVAEFPAPGAAPFDQTTDQWRTANDLHPDANGKARARFTVNLPTGPGSRRVAFSAYAFNGDRIKSDNATRVFAALPARPRPRRTFVLAIGIDAYQQQRLRLHFAASDASLIDQRMAQLPGQDVHRLALVGDRQPITKAMMLAALHLLATGDHPADLGILAKAGIDGRVFAGALPDDVVIVTFSGHGWADARGNFYLLPADAVWADSAPLPVTTSLLSSAELADALKRIDAREMALVIDACHSAASVDSIGFKPGPMGDAGLGQLAWDKGIRILAAAGRDDVAMEDQSRRHGLLTYALAHDGIDDKGFGQADLNGDGRIMLDEWLRFALAQLPSLSQQAKQHLGADAGHQIGHFTVISDNQAVPPHPQLPALFDFTRRPSREPLREKRP
jgi:hypothetical protein